jgi:hypothetical protein
MSPDDIASRRPEVSHRVSPRYNTTSPCDITLSHPRQIDEPLNYRKFPQQRSECKCLDDIILGLRTTAPTKASQNVTRSSRLHNVITILANC